MSNAEQSGQIQEGFGHESLRKLLKVEESLKNFLNYAKVDLELLNLSGVITIQTPTIWAEIMNGTM